MTSEEFKAWRERMGWTQKEAAEHLGMTAGTLIDYEAGVRRGRKNTVVIPHTVFLACRMLEVERNPITKFVRDDAGGYQVMINGREREITDLTHDEAIMALKEAIDNFEDVDDLAKRLNTVLDDHRFGRRKGQS